MENKEKRIIGFNNLRLLLLVFVSAALILFCLFSNSEMEMETRSILMSITYDHENQLLQDSNGVKTIEVVKSKLANLGGVRGLSASAPPNCQSKCGTCTPCNPILVCVPPEMSGTAKYYPPAPKMYVLADYYPQKWMCICGGKLYPPSF